MRKTVGIFFSSLGISFILLLIFGSFFDGGHYIETVLLSIGAVIILLLCYLISIIHYLINLLNTGTDEDDNITVFSVDQDNNNKS